MVPDLARNSSLLLLNFRRHHMNIQSKCPKSGLYYCSYQATLVMETPP